MGENSHLYRPETLLQNGRTTDKYTSAALSLAVPADLVRLNQSRESWDQMSSYTQNLGLSATDLSKFTASQFVSQAHDLMPRVPPSRDRERRDGPSHGTSNPLDMSMPRTQNYFPPGVLSSDHHSSPSRNQRNFLSSSQTPPYIPRGSSFSNSSKTLPHRNNRASDVSALLDAVQKHDVTEITRLTQGGVDVNSSEAGFTALHQAAKNGDIDVIKCLLMRGASTTLSDRSGRLPEDYGLKHNISVEAIRREVHLASQRSKQSVPFWKPSHSKEPSSTSIAFPTNIPDHRRSSRPPDHRISSEHRPPDHRIPDHRICSELRQDHHISSDHRPSDHRVSSEHRLPDHRLTSEHRQPDHRVSSEHRLPDHRISSEHRLPGHRVSSDQRLPDHRLSGHRPPDHLLSSNQLPPDNRLSSEHRHPDNRMPPEHRVPNHRMLSDLRPPDTHSLEQQVASGHRPPDYRFPPEHRQTDKRLPEYRPSGPAEDRKFHRDTSLQQDNLQQSYGTPEKTEERYNNTNHAERAQSQKSSSYDRFPSPFDHIHRPPQSGSLPPGLELLVKSNDPISNGPKPHKVPEPIRPSKYGPERSVGRPEQRPTVPFVQKPPGSEKTLLYSESKKPLFSIDEITKPSRSTQNTQLDKNNRLAYISQASATNKRDSSPLLLGVSPSRLPSPFPPEFYNLVTKPTGLEAQNRISVASTLPMAQPLFNLRAADVLVPYPLSSVFPYINPSNLPIPPTPVSQVTPSQPHPVQQTPRTAQTFTNSRERTSSSKTAETPGRKPSEPKLQGSERRLAHSRYHEAHPSDKNRPRDSIHPDVRLPRLEPTLNHPDPTPAALAQQSSFLPSPTAKTTSSPTLSTSIVTQLSQSIPTPTVSSSVMIPAHPYSFEALEEQGSSHDVDMRKLVRQESKDTDMRPFLQMSGPVFSEHQEDKASRKIEKRRDSSEHKNKNRRDSTSSGKNKLEKRLSSSKSIEKRDLSDPKVSHSKTAHFSSKNEPKKHYKPRKDSSSDKNKSEMTPKRKYNKVIAPIAKVAHEKLQDEAKVKKVDDSKPEAKPRGRKGRKRKHSPTREEQQTKVTTTSAIESPTAKESAATTFSTAATSEESKELSRLSSVEDSVGKREKRRKKSEPEDEYVYEWMYDDFSSEPENDDSEDEDFHCPVSRSVAPARRGRRRGIRSRSSRQSHRHNRATFFADDSSPEELLSDVDELPHRGRPVKAKPGRRGRKPSPRGPRVSPRKHKISRKLSSESLESEKSAENQVSSEKLLKDATKIKSLSSDKDEPVRKDPEKPAAKRGRGYRKPRENTDHSPLKKQVSDNREENAKALVKSLRGRKSATTESEKTLEDPVKHPVTETTKKRSKEKSKDLESESKTVNNAIKETDLSSNALKETRLTCDTQEPIVIEDSLPEVASEDSQKSIPKSEETTPEKKEKETKTTSPARRGRKPFSEAERLLAAAKRKNKSVSVRKKESNLPLGKKRGRKPFSETKQATLALSNSKRESKTPPPEEQNGRIIPDEKIVREEKKEDFIPDPKQDKKSPRKSKHQNEISSDAKQDNKILPDGKRGKKLLRQKRESTLSSKKEWKLINEENKEPKLLKHLKRERKLIKQKSLGEEKLGTKTGEEKSSLASPKKEKDSVAPTKVEKRPKNDAKLTKKREKSSEFAKSSEAEVLPVSPSLIELYTGKHVAPPPVNDENKPSTEANTTEDNNLLFWDDLTETEAQVLVSRGLLSSEIDDTAKTVTEPVKPVSSVQLPIGAVQNKGLETKPEPHKDLFPIKVPKKRGRKPNSMLHSKNQELKAPPEKRQKMSSTINKSKVHPNFTLNNTSSKFATTTPDAIQRPRKGRPPGSLNKKTLNKVASVAKILKKPGRKALIKTGRIPDIKATKVISNNLARSRPSTPSKKHLQVWTPGAIRPSDKDRGADSPCSSVSSTPHLGKHLLPRILSRGSTPIRESKRTPNPSPLPPNVKKLTCNNAIGETVLHKAVRHGYTDNILYYLEQGFEVNTKDNAGYTALHEACVKGRVDAARLLLEFGADVNINSEDGTRPIHDAVEYDHVEMTRLLLSCGADPMLSKFSGRAVRDMIHGHRMKTFLSTYLSELKPTEKEKSRQLQEWNLSASAVLDPKGLNGCDIFANPPDEDPICDEMEFELLEEEPVDSYLLHPSETSSRGNYYCLSELVRSNNCSRGDFLLQHPADIKITEAKKLKEDLEKNWVKKKIDNAEGKENLVELIAAESYRKNCRVFKVDSCGVVTPILSAQSRSKPTYFHHGAFCEQRTYSFVDPQFSGVGVSGENVDLPSCSRSASQGCDSPDFSDSETIMSGVTALPAPPNETNVEKAPAEEQKNDFSELSNQNGIVQKPPAHNGFSSPSPVPDSQPVLNVDTSKHEKPDTCLFQPPIDIAPYSPTSDLRPPVISDNDPTRALTETENAVLNLTYDTGLPGIHLHRTEPSMQYNYFKEVTQSPNPPPNHVEEFNS